MGSLAVVVNKSNPKVQASSRNGAGQKLANPLNQSGPARLDFGKLAIQAKLKVSRPGDPYEQEADRVAEQVVAMPAGNGAPNVKEHGSDRLGRKCKNCEMGKEEDERPHISRKESTASSSGPLVPEDTEEYVSNVDGRGFPLDAQTRQFMESRFGFDFGRVRIHTGETAARSAESIDALAYTVGNEIVFAGRYEPGDATGKKLLAHELAHVVQQSNSLQRATVMRQNADSDCGSEFEGKWIERVVVEQEGRQSVTLHWSDGSIDSDICSTGKGHCCVDPSNPEGAAGSVAESRMDGSNLTPITQGREFRIRERKKEHNNWKFWSTFVPERGIALHQHHTVMGEPLSHGCVRLHEPIARKIHCGSRVNQTRVEVRGFARPMCNSDNLVNEWVQDFESAATPTDGEGISPGVRSGILETRRTLRRALGVTQQGLERMILGLREPEQESELESPFGPSLSREAVARIIPRCRGTAQRPTAEEMRGVSSDQTTTPDQILASSRFNRFLPQLTSALAGAGSMRSARRIVREQGQRLWEAATARARGSTADTDDRPIYWTRLQMARALRQWQPGFRLDMTGREELINLLERASRGMESATFGRRRENVKRILISGFDLFQLAPEQGGDVRRENPSGAAVLALDGQSVAGNGVSAEIQGVIFPVRFADFDAGRVETFFRPYLSPEPSVDMIMTISMGASSSFEVEEYAGRRRSSGFPDNLGTTSPTGEPPGLGAGPEFIRTTLPAGAIRQSLGRTGPLPGETEITEIPAGSSAEVRVKSGGPSSGSTAVRGSGGSYLSNEIFYRTSLLRLETGASIPVGHLHTPLLLPPAGTGISSQQFEDSRNQIVQQILDIIRSSLPSI